MIKFSNLGSFIKKNITRISFTIFAIILISVYVYDSVLQGIKKKEEGWHGMDMSRDQYIKNSVWPSKGNLKHKIWLGLEEYKYNYTENPNDTSAMIDYADFLFESHHGRYAMPIYEKIIEIYPERIDIQLKLFMLYNNYNEYDKLINRYINNNELLFKLKNNSNENERIDSVVNRTKQVISRKNELY